MLLVAAVTQELEQFKTAAAHWQTEAERRIKVGQHRVDQAEARANQAETAASVDRVRSLEVEHLQASRDATVEELQKLRECVRTVAQQFFEARNRARARARSAGSGGMYGMDLTQRVAADGSDHPDAQSVDLLGTGYIASILDLAPSELNDIMGAVSSDGVAIVDEGAHEFHEQLTQLLDAPLDEGGLRDLLLSLVDERVNQEEALRLLAAEATAQYDEHHSDVV
jgi:hypothetical protein